MDISTSLVPQTFQDLFLKAGTTYNLDESKRYGDIIVEKGATLTTSSGVTIIRARTLRCHGTLSGRILDVFAYDVNLDAATVTASGATVAADSDITIRYLTAYTKLGATLSAGGGAGTITETQVTA